MSQPSSFSFAASARLACGTLFVLATGTYLGIAQERMRGLENQMATLDVTARSDERVQEHALLAVEANFVAMSSDLQAMHRELRGALEASAGDVAMSAELESLQARMLNLDVELADHAGTISTLSNDVSEVKNEELPALAAAGQEQLTARDASMRDLIDSALQVAEASMAQIDEVKRLADDKRDLTQMWRELVGPVVQLAGESSVGSGVLLESERTEDGYRTVVVTAWHVVRDILEDARTHSSPIPVAIYREDGSIQQEFADLACHNVDLDAALLVLRSKQDFPCGARLASRAQLEEISIFKRIYAVGCPLGNDPIPTNGEIATCNHMIDGSQYWMINAPTYIGNSGGGIFDGETHELLGIFSKIYTHGSLRPTIVPHMGLVTPLNRVYDWLVAEGFASEPNKEASIQIASAFR